MFPQDGSSSAKYIYLKIHLRACFHLSRKSHHFMTELIMSVNGLAIYSAEGLKALLE